MVMLLQKVGGNNFEIASAPPRNDSLLDLRAATNNISS